MAERDVDAIGELMQEVFTTRDGLRVVLEQLAKAAMESEVSAHVGADRHERSQGRRGYRNGTKARRLQTRAGELHLEVPQVRGCEPYHPTMFHRWQRSERALLVACAEMYFQGVSTRNVRRVLEKMCGGDISSATVSRVSQELDERLLLFRHRRLDETTYPYLHIDARYEKVRVEGRVVSQAVLVVAGFTAQGERRILDWRVADSESEGTWSEVFRDLKDRGLTGVKLITSDAHAGMRKAMERHFQGVQWQRCRVHYQREMGSKVSYRRRKELHEDLHGVFAPEEIEECLRRGEEMAVKWEGRYPKVAAMLREGLEDCLAVLHFPAHHQRRLRSTNMLENLMKRLKKRTRVVMVFPSRSACDRLVGAQLIEVDEQWQTEGKKYFNMDEVDLELLGRPTSADRREGAAA